MSDQLDYLDFYKTIEAPGFAVLVKGEWGVGKTYKVKAKLRDDEHYYVSLFGLKSSQQVYSTLLTSIHDGVGQSIGALKNLCGGKKSKFLGLSVPEPLVDWAIEQLIAKAADGSRVIVFDDLERSAMPFKELWGLINRFVEHDLRKVVIICHDQKLKSKLSGSAEKIIGHEILVKPDLIGALPLFLSDKKLSCGKRLETISDLISESFERSGVSSLRVLKMVLIDIDRFVNCLPTRYFDNERSIKKLFGFFLDFAFGYRSAKIALEDIERKNELVAKAWQDSKNGNETDQSSEVAKMQRQNSDIALELLRSSDLVEMLVYGRFEEAKLIEWLDKVLFPQSFGQWPAWRRFMAFDHLEDQEVTTIIEELDQQFENRSVTNIGDLLHIFAIRLMLITKSQHRGDLDSEVQACKEYLDEIFKREPLAFKQTDEYEFSDFRQSFGGYALFITDETRDHIFEIGSHLNKKKNELADQNRPAIVEKLLTLMVTESETFLECVSGYGKGDHDLALMPVFKDADAKDFVDRWMQAPKSEWANISRAFAKRYQEGFRLQHELADELEFARSLIHELREYQTGLEGVAAYRLSRHIPDIKFPDVSELDQ
jgi:hypothetical protein